MSQKRIPGPLWNPSERYVRFEEGTVGGAVGKGSYGKCYSSYDRVLHLYVVVKRHALNHNALLEREL